MPQVSSNDYQMSVARVRGGCRRSHVCGRRELVGILGPKSGEGVGIIGTMSRGLGGGVPYQGASVWVWVFHSSIYLSFWTQPVVKSVESKNSYSSGKLILELSCLSTHTLPWDLSHDACYVTYPTHPHPSRTEWQTPVKALPSRNYCCRR